MGAVGNDVSGFSVQRVDAKTTVGSGAAEFLAGNEIDGDVAFVQCDVRMPADERFERSLDSAAGSVLGVYYSPVTVAAFARQVIFHCAIRLLLLAERHAAVDEPANRLRSLAHDEFNGVAATQAGPGIKCVLDVRVEGIFLPVQNGGHTALSIETGALRERRFGKDGNPRLVRHPQSKAETGSAATDDQDVGGPGGFHARSMRGGHICGVYDILSHVSELFYRAVVSQGQKIEQQIPSFPGFSSEL